MEQSPLPPYTGPTTTCPKCGHNQADTTWQPPSTSLTTYGQVSHEPRRDKQNGQPGWLLRTCRHCAFPWAEATRDTTTAA